MRLAQVENGIVVNVIEVEPENIPDWAAGWPEVEMAGPGWIVEGGNAVPPAADPAAALAEARVAAMDRLTGTIATARVQLITDLPGQDMIYLAKEAEARAWVNAVAPDLADYPLLAAEIGITAPNADQLAQLWLNMAALWRAAAAQLEALRLSTQAAIASAASPEEIDAIMEPI